MKAFGVRTAFAFTSHSQGGLQAFGVYTAFPCNHPSHLEVFGVRTAFPAIAPGDTISPNSPLTKSVLDELGEV